MKKIISALLVVLLLVGAPLLAGAASLTLTNEEHHNIGSLNMVTGTAAVNSGDTLSIGLSTIVGVIMTPRNTAAAPSGNVTYGYRVTTSSTGSQTITINTSAEGTTWNFIILGTGM